MPTAFKFAFVAGCFAVALLSYFKCHSRKDWLWLACGLAFTVLADFFLVLRNQHLPGVAVFCFAHVCYIFRIIEDRGPPHFFAAYSAPPSRKPRERGPRKILCFSAVLAAVAAAFFVGSVAALAAIYACLFAVNLYVNARALRSGEARLPMRNRALALAGLILFALCDVNVLLANLPRYAGAPQWLAGAFPLIWVFYLPSQALLAASAFRFAKTKNL